jgi:hypothetical protein
MKRRVRRTVNFLAFNLLFFSLYLNFIQKDSDNSVDPVLVQDSNSPAQVVNAHPVEKNNEVAKEVIN